jgi:hypothetical protein
MILISALEQLLGWEHLLLYGRFDCVEMKKFLMINIILSCRSSTGVLVCFVCGHLFSRWRIGTYLEKSIHD